jgi:hypothetical protein
LGRLIKECICRDGAEPRLREQQNRKAEGGLMRKKILISALIVILLALLIWLIIFIKKFLAIDGCLDHGGRWNYSTNECEGSRTNK